MVYSNYSEFLHSLTYFQDIKSVDIYMPGLLNNTITFLKNYKLPSGGERNSIAFNDKAQDKVSYL